MAVVAGTRVGPYEIVAALGAGGMGEVYKARDTRLDRTVAIKVVAASVAADPQFRERFDREARTISQLNHPHICTLYDVGQHEGTAYLVMEFLEGDTLARRLSSVALRGLPWDDVVTIATQIAEALGIAHSAGIIHRDIKPENVMIRPDGLVKVLDFGVAKLVEGHGGDSDDSPTIGGGPTTFGSVVGTTKYMSPEQARGLPVDARSDIFSFGVLLYHMVSGRMPFDGATDTDVVVAILERQPLLLTHHRPDAPPEVQRIVVRCLEKQPECRYASASELMADLKKLRAQADANRSAKAAPSIAVLPFVNMSTDPENEYFCDGIAEELINALSKIEQLRVAARTSAFSFKGKAGDLREMGRTLNVSTVLEGSVRKAGNRLRVTAQLVSVTDGYHLWSERYDRQLQDVFEIQDEISLAIVNALRVKLLGEERAELAKRHTENVEAYQLYLKGRHHWHKWNEEGFNKSRECMERAIQLDPDYAMAYTGLADVHLAMGGMGFRPTDILPKARAALTRALELDQRLAEAWVLLAVTHVYERDWAHADRAAARAIELDPRSGHAYLLSGIVALYGGGDRLDEALAALKRAVELDPLAPMWNFQLALAYLARGDRDRSQEQIRAGLDIDPHFWAAHFLRGILHLDRGKHAEAVQAFEDAARCSNGGPFATGYLACALSRAGDRPRAERELAVLLTSSKERYVPALSIAYAYLGLGPTERVFEWLERAYDELEFWLPWHLQYDPVFADLRTDPRMIDLVRRLQLPV